MSQTASNMMKHELPDDFGTISSYKFTKAGNLTIETDDNRIIRIYVTPISQGSSIFCFCSRVNEDRPNLHGRGSMELMVAMRDDFIASIGLGNKIEEAPPINEVKNVTPGEDVARNIRSKNPENPDANPGHSYLKQRIGTHGESETDIVPTPEVLKIKFNLKYPPRKNKISNSMKFAIAGVAILVVSSSVGYFFANTQPSPKVSVVQPVMPQASKPASVAAVATPKPANHDVRLNALQIDAAGHGPWGFQSVPTKKLWKGNGNISFFMPGGGNANSPADFAILGLNL